MFKILLILLVGNFNPVPLTYHGNITTSHSGVKSLTEANKEEIFNNIIFEKNDRN